MITKETYTIEYVNTLREKYKKDPSLLERVLFAFGLLEAITRVGMPLIFKGGTSLMLNGPPGQSQCHLDKKLHRSN